MVIEKSQIKVVKHLKFVIIKSWIATEFYKILED
jgi:hypothetical protein